LLPPLALHSLASEPLATLWACAATSVAPLNPMQTLTGRPSRSPAAHSHAQVKQRAGLRRHRHEVALVPARFPLVAPIVVPLTTTLVLAHHCQCGDYLGVPSSSCCSRASLLERWQNGSERCPHFATHQICHRPRPHPHCPQAPTTLRLLCRPRRLHRCSLRAGAYLWSSPVWEQDFPTDAPLASLPCIASSPIDAPSSSSLASWQQSQHATRRPRNSSAASPHVL